MTLWPEYNCDLDAQTRDALRERNPSALTKGNVNDVQTRIPFEISSYHGGDRVTDFPFKDSGYASGDTSLLHIAAWWGESAVVQELLQRGADTNCRDSRQYTPLLKACDFTDRDHKADATSVACLLKHGADPNGTLPTGESALVLCLGRLVDLDKQTRIAEMLIDFGADPNISAPTGATPLMFAARDNSERLTRKLLKAGAQTETRTPDGETALDIARRRGSNAVTKLLQDGV